MGWEWDSDLEMGWEMGNPLRDLEYGMEYGKSEYGRTLLRFDQTKFVKHHPTFKVCLTVNYTFYVCWTIIRKLLDDVGR